MTETTEQFKRQMPRNFSLQVLAFATRIAVGIVLTPYLVRHLGRAAYGLVPLAAAMTEYVAIITQTISSAISRFLTIALQRGDMQDANRVFSTAFFSYLGLSLVQIPVFGLIIYRADVIFTIPEPLYRDAVILLMCSAASFLLSLMCGVFGVPIYANNRLDIARTLDVSRQIVRLCGILAFFAIFGPALRYVGYVSLATTILVMIPTVVVGKRLAPELRLSVRAYDWRKLREVTSMGGWLLVNYLGFLLFLRIDVWVCNRFISAEAAGDYAAVLQWSNLIRQAGMLLSGLIGPMIMIYYARSEINRLIRLAQVSVRVMCLLLAIPISILCVFSPAVLTLWLGESFAPLAPLMVIMVCHLTINVGITPVFSVRTALNKVKVPALMSVVGGIANMLLAILLAKYLSWGIYGVAIAGAVTLTLLNALWNPVYTARILHQPWYTFVKPSVSGMLGCAALSLVGLAIRHFVHPTSWAQLLAACMTTALIGALGVWLILPAADRALFMNLLPSKLRFGQTRLRKV